MDPIWRMIERNLSVLRHWTHNEENTEQVLDWLGRGLREWFIDQGLSPDHAESLSEKTVCQIGLKFQDEDADRSQYWRPGDFQNWCFDIASKQYSVGITRPDTPSLIVSNSLRIAIDLLASRDRWLISWHLGQTDDDTTAASVRVSIDDLHGAWGRDALKCAILRFRDLLEGDSDLLDWIGTLEGDVPDDDRPDRDPPRDSILVSTEPREE